MIGRIVGRLFACSLLLAFVTGPLRQATAQTAYDRISASGRDVRITKVAKGVYQFTTMRDSYVRQLNSVAVITRDQVLVFDTNTRPSSARIILKLIRVITRKPVTLIVNSHGHPDHWSGNQVFIDAFPSAEIIATDKAARDMREKAGIWVPRFQQELATRRAAAASEAKAGRRADGSVATPDQRRQAAADLTDYASFVAETNALRRVFPTRTYSGGQTFRRGGVEFRLIELTGDQAGTTVMYLPQQKVVVTGDAISFPIPYVSSHPTDQIAGLRLLAELDAKVIVPGHGPAFHDRKFLLLELELLETVAAEVAIARAHGAGSIESVRKMDFGEALRASFTHGDADLDARFTSRAADLATFMFEERMAAQFPANKR